MVEKCVSSNFIPAVIAAADFAFRIVSALLLQYSQMKLDEVLLYPYKKERRSYGIFCVRERDI